MSNNVQTTKAHDRNMQFDQIVTYNPGFDYNYDAEVMLKH
jgi:hypothetical protein